MLKAPPEVVSIVPPRIRPARTELKVLDAYIEAIRLWSSQPAQADSIRFANTEVAVQPWVARAIHRFCNAPGDGGGTLEDIVTEGVAVIAKCRTDLDAGRGDVDNLRETYARQAELMLATAVGSVVVRELQKLCNALLAHGDNEVARELNQFQHEVRRAVQEVRGSLSENERERATEFASAFAGEPEALAPDLPVEKSPASRPRVPTQVQPRRRAANPSAAPHSQAVFHEPTPARPSRFRSHVLGIAVSAMVVGLAAYGVSGFRDTAVKGDASESLNAAVSSIPGVTEVQDRMPYIVLTVREGFWDASDPSTHEDWVDNIRRLVERHGYSGLVVRSTGGTPLAEWVHDRGIKFATD